MTEAGQCDLLVAGAGPAGWGVALHAARAGLDVVVVDPRLTDVASGTDGSDDVAGGIDKACGEGLMPSALRVLGELGVNVPGEPLRGIRYASAGFDGPSVDARFRDGEGRGVRRTELSSALARRGADLGVRTVGERVLDLQQDGSEVRVRVGGRGDAGRVLRSRYLVAADGMHSGIRSMTGVAVRAPAPVRYGLRRHYRLAGDRSPGDMVSVFWAADAEAYVTPVGPDVVNVAVLCAGGEPYDAWLARFPRLTELLAGATPLTAVRGAGPLRHLTAGRRVGRVMLLGDAAGSLDALTGEGIATSLQCGRVLTRCVLDDRPQDYPWLWRRTTLRSRLMTTTLLRAVSVPAVRSMLLPAAGRLPRVFSRVVDALA